MPSYTPTHVSQPHKWDGQYGSFADYTLTIPEFDKPVVLTLKPETPAPVTGQAIELEVSPHPKFTDRMKARRPAAGGSGGGGSREFKADPAKQRAIAMESAQKVAVEVLRLAMETGVWKAPDQRPIGEMAGVVKVIAQALYAQIDEVSAA